MPQKIHPHLITIPEEKIPLIAEADVVVCGGGTAGFIAAIAAARAGAKTILLERFGFLGGSLTGTYASLPGYFFDAKGQQIIKGIGWEFIQRMVSLGQGIAQPGIWWAQIFPEAVKTAALEMVVEAGVEILLYTWVSAPIMQAEWIKYLVIQNKAGRGAIAGKVYIDTTGDADLAFLSGAPVELLLPDQLWQTSLDLTIANVDPSKIIRWAKDNLHRIKGWVQYPDDISTPGLHPTISLIVLEDDSLISDGKAIVHQGPVPTVKLMIHPTISRVQGSVEIDGTDPQQLTYAEIEARRRALAHLDYLKANIPGYENAIVIGESPLGVRETRRIRGDYCLTLQDLHEQRRFPDVIALNCRALDRHIKGEVFKLELLPGNHDIPLRALIPQKVQNLVVAGRCISSDHEANASLRGAATCMATGHAAGVAAALTAQRNGCIRETELTDIQTTLIQQGAILQTNSDLNQPS